MTLRLPKLLDDGCVLQAGVDMHIWGTGDPGRIVLTRLADERHMVQVKDDGTWNAPYGPIEAGGPYELTICYEDGAERISRQCYAGRGVPVLRAVEYGTAYGLGARRLSTGVGP